MALTSNLTKTASPILISIAIVWGGFAFLESSRHLSLLIFGVLFALCAYYVVLLRGRARDAALIGASLKLGLFVIEIAVWKFGGAPTFYKEKGSWAPRPDLGWSPARPGPIHEKKIDASGRIVFDVVNTIDAFLTRKVESNSNGPTIAFFGDSMTFGAGVNDDETLPQAFADQTGRRYNVLNLAASAYGPQQFLRALELGVHDARLRRDPRLIVMLTAPWHAFRTSCKDENAWLGPSYEMQDGAPVFAGPCSARATGLSGALRNLFRSTEAYKFFLGTRERPLEPADIDLYVAILSRAGRIVREKFGAPTLILYLPDNLATPRYRLGAGYSNDDIVHKLREGGLTVLDASIDASAYPGQILMIPGDGHPSGFAYKIMAEQIKDFVAREIEPSVGR